MGLTQLVLISSVLAQSEVPLNSRSTGTQVSSGGPATASLTLEELKAIGATKSSYTRLSTPFAAETLKSKVEAYLPEIRPILEKSCMRCHGSETQEGNIRIDTLDPDLVHGNDTNWWLEIVAVLSNGEMPPAEEPPLPDSDRSKLIEWLSTEVQVASMVRRAEKGRSSFRRMTRYEYNHALQDLLGEPYDFAKDLPPESISEDGFQNSSELLHMSASQFATYREIGRSALRKVTVRGERPPATFWSITMRGGAVAEWAKQDAELEKIRVKFKDDPDKQKKELDQRVAAFQKSEARTHYKDLKSGRIAPVAWDYGEAKYAWKPLTSAPEVPAVSEYVTIIPPKRHFIVELGDTVPDEGALRVRFRASRLNTDSERIPSLQLEFGWQASNDSEASVRVSDKDILITALPEQPDFYQWDIPLCEVTPRNSVRGVWKMGDLPSPSEFIKFVNSSVTEGDIQIDYVEVSAPVYEQWPPVSHAGIFLPSDNSGNEKVYASEVLARFMEKAWRRPVHASEVDQKVALFEKLRPACSDFQDAMVEVLATVLASPKFLYLVHEEDGGHSEEKQIADLPLSQEELATRLSMFLWTSIPDQELRQLAEQKRLQSPEVLMLKSIACSPMFVRDDSRSTLFANGWVCSFWISCTWTKRSTQSLIHRSRKRCKKNRSHFFTKS